VKALNNHEFDGKTRNSGEIWLIYGPNEVWPTVDIQIMRTIPAIIKLEGLNFYVFKFDSFVLSIMMIIFVLFLYFTLLRR